MTKNKKLKPREPEKCLSDNGEVLASFVEMSAFARLRACQICAPSEPAIYSRFELAFKLDRALTGALRCPE
jgi:hypothetical protein